MIVKVTYLPGAKIITLLFWQKEHTSIAQITNLFDYVRLGYVWLQLRRLYYVRLCYVILSYLL